MLPSSKSQLSSPNIEDSHDILLESVAQDKYVLDQVTAAVVNAADAHGITTIVLACIENHVEWVDVECPASDGDSMLRRLRVAIHDVGTHGIAVDGGRIKRGVDFVGKFGRVVVESGS